MAKGNIPIVATPGRVEAIPLTKSETTQRLAQHMSILEAMGYSDLATLGNLDIGLKGSQHVAILQKSGVLLPGPNAIFQPNPVALSGQARKCNPAGVFENITGTVLVTDSKKPMLPGNIRAEINLNVAYWFGTQINLQDNTTVVIDANVKSLVIIAETLIIGNNVTISWDRPSSPMPLVPSKPGTPPSWPQATSIGSERGRDGYPGTTGGQGTHGQPAPEIEIWFLDATGFPKIDLRGQDGTTGGRGGDGGDGGRGQKGCNTAKNWGACSQEQGGGGNGGNGGRPGDGGRGGNGGAGGKFSVFSIDNMINTWLQGGLTISVDGGSAGSGGDPGRPGEGGLGGDKGDKLHTVCQNNSRTPGVKGNSGPSGLRGPDGVKGELQSNSIQYSKIDPIDFYIELTKPAIVSINAQKAFVGDSITVNGLRFNPGDKVYIEGYDGQINIPCPTTFVSQSLLTFVVPDVPGGFALFEVVQSDSTRSANKGTLLVRPKIDAIVPAGRLKPGEYYFIKGTGLGRSGNIWINGEDIGSFVSVDKNTLKFKVKRPSNAEYNPGGENVKLKVVNAEGADASLSNHSTEIPVVLDTYCMLVFGDSVMWGGGLPEHLKYYSLAADYVSSKRGNVMVYRTIKAHHGAKIGRGDNKAEYEMNGEISSRWPTILQQVDSQSAVPNASEVDLILIDGGANDLPIVKVMLESDSGKLATVKQDLKNNTRQYCYTDMVFMLQKVISYFPKAQVIVTGYYHIVSEESDMNFLQRMILSIWEDVSHFPPFGNSMEDTRKKIIALSNLWVAESNKNLKEAVKSVNDSLPGDPQIFFVDPETVPSHAAHAPNSLLWEPDSLGGPTDPMWKGGREQQRDANEPRIRNEDNYFMVKANSSYHPNPAGAQRFFEKMKPVLDLSGKVSRVAFRCTNGYYLCAEGGGNGTLIANRSAVGPWETFEMVDLKNNQFALRSINGFYVCAENGGGSTISVNRTRLGSWETFTLVPHASGFVFKTMSGNFLSLGNGDLLTASATQLTASEIFQIL